MIAGSGTLNNDRLGSIFKNDELAKRGGLPSMNTHAISNNSNINPLMGIGN